MTGPLARRYRRRMFAYPRAYRRSRGDELLGTLLEAAPPGRTRPTLRETADLVRHGLRARIGRPASRSVVLWAVLATVISGVFGAAFATRLAWETARPLPSAAEAEAMLAGIVPGQRFAGVQDAPAMFVIYGSPLSWTSADDLLLGDGGEYGLASVGGGVDGVPDVPPQQIVDQATDNLHAQGWTVYPPIIHNLYDCIGPPCDPDTIPTSTTIVAERGDTTFSLQVNFESTVDTTFMTAQFQRATPSAVHPFGVAGGLLTAAVAFLLFGWASRRTEPGHPARGSVLTLFGVAMALWWAPTLVAVPSMAAHHLDEPHPSWHPLWEWLGQPALSLPFLIGTGAALLGLALAAIPHPQPVAVSRKT
ncbi:hypothetical protein [Dactylosporangium fulvum]|uniref:Integral membrane protein n=1 Tax=Dactylosporangium fulvum TaxID=53359 RepID=A0ABY5WA75_9ACTN|nr:hypothetical protein [Dactylosporangium fulvum]UWP86457.1 hypothetical protein Dfulv_20325 [Dactylosporangium fulvum]